MSCRPDGAKFSFKYSLVAETHAAFHLDVVFELKLNFRYGFPIQQVTLPIESWPERTRESPGNKCGFGSRIVAEPDKSVVTVYVRAAGKADIGAIVLRAAITIDAPSDIAAREVEFVLISEPVAGAVVVARVPVHE